MSLMEPNANFAVLVPSGAVWCTLEHLWKAHDYRVSIALAHGTPLEAVQVRRRPSPQASPSLWIKAALAAECHYLARGEDEIARDFRKRALLIDIRMGEIYRKHHRAHSQLDGRLPDYEHLRQQIDNDFAREIAQLIGTLDGLS